MPKNITVKVMYVVNKAKGRITNYDTLLTRQGKGGEQGTTNRI